MKKNRNDLSIISGLLIAVFFFLVTGLATYLNIYKIKKDSLVVSRTHEMITSIDDLALLLNDAETGQRGYIITGKSSYLEPYENSKIFIDSQIQNIERLNQENSEQKIHISNIKNLINKKFLELSETINLRNNFSFEKALSEITTDHGKNIMDDLRSELSAARNIESETRKNRILEMERAHNVALFTGIVSSSLGAILSFFIAFLLNRSVKLRALEQWFKNGQVGLSAVMQGDLSADNLAQNVLKFLSQYIEAHVSIFFIKENSIYRRCASYGVLESENFIEKFSEGEGLLGQSAIDAKYFSLKNVPNGYITVGSGFGQTNPKHLVIIPASVDGAVNAVLEFGFIHSVDEYVLEFLEKISVSIGAAVQSARYRENLRHLLEETQSQSKKLQQSEEELKVQQEELQIANEEMEERTRELEGLNRQIIEGGERLRATVNNALDGIITINELGIIEDFNPASERIFGYMAQEAVGHNVKMLMPEPYHGEHDGYLSRYIRTGDPHIIGTTGREVRGRRKDGSEFPMDLSVGAFVLGGRRYFSGTVRDICSHDMQEPARMMYSYSELLQQDYAHNLDEDGKKYIKFIMENACNMRKMISDILTFSRIGREAPDLEIVNCENILHEVLEKFKDTIDQKNAVIQHNNLPILQTSPTLISILFQNLIGNALKFQDSSKKPEIIIKAQKKEKKWEFSVMDNGIGIDPDFQDKVFSIFQRYHRKEQYPGTGIGLSTCKKFIEIYGGSIWFESELGAGTCFHFTILEE